MLFSRVEISEIQKYMALSREPGVISFAAGFPDINVLPTDELKQSYAQLAREDHHIFQYSPPHQGFRKNIQGLMEAMSIPCQTDELLITNGAQQGIQLIASLFFDSKKKLMIEPSCYPGFLQLARVYGFEYEILPQTKDQLIDLNALENILKKPSTLPLLYVIPNGHNPLGVTMPSQMRKDLAFLADGCINTFPPH